MSRFYFFPQTRWSYSPVQQLNDSMIRLEQAKAIGMRCTKCEKILIDHIYIRDSKRFHEACYFNKDISITL
jgi:hypothetical protein